MLYCDGEAKYGSYQSEDSFCLFNITDSRCFHSYFFSFVKNPGHRRPNLGLKRGPLNLDILRQNTISPGKLAQIVDWYCRKKCAIMKSQASRYTAVFILIIMVLVVVTAISLAPANGKDKQPEEPKEEVVLIEYGENNYPRTKAVKRVVETGEKAAGSLLAMSDDVLRGLDLPGLTREFTRALSEVRISDLTAEVDQVISEIDWNSINDEVERTMDDIHYELRNPRLREDVRMSLRNVEDDLANATSAAKGDMRTVREELIEARYKLAESRKEAEASNTELVNVDRVNVKDLVKQVEEEGLIEMASGYEIEKVGSRVYINGQRQPLEVYDKHFRKFKDDFFINGDEQTMVIEVQ